MFSHKIQIYEISLKSEKRMHLKKVKYGTKLNFMNQLKFQDSSAIKSWRSAIGGIWKKFWAEGRNHINYLCKGLKNRIYFGLRARTHKSRTSFAPLSTNISVKHPQITFFDRNTVFYFIPYFTQKSVLTNISFNLYFTIHALLYSVILLLFTIFNINWTITHFLATLKM